MRPITASMLTVAARRIAARLPDLTRDQLRSAIAAALPGLDNEAADEVGCGGYFDGPALTSLNAMAQALGLPHSSPDGLAEDNDFFVNSGR